MIIGSNIIRNGLILYLDCCNLKSYPTTETTWSDISTNLNHLKYQYNNDLIIYDSTNNIPSLYRTVNEQKIDFYRATNSIYLPNNFTMSCWCYFISGGSSANGIITNHSHSNNAGAGITAKYISSSDYRISCNTGTGSDRTFFSYYGTTNIKDSWHFLLLRFIKSNNNLSLWVDGNNEKELTYSMYCIDTFFDVFGWSTTYIYSSYKPSCKINNVMVYNIALSDSEILQNYNSLKQRFNK